MDSADSHGFSVHIYFHQSPWTWMRIGLRKRLVQLKRSIRVTTWISCSSLYPLFCGVFLCFAGSCECSLCCKWFHWLMGPYFHSKITYFDTSSRQVAAFFWKTLNVQAGESASGRFMCNIFAAPSPALLLPYWSTTHYQRPQEAFLIDTLCGPLIESMSKALGIRDALYTQCVAEIT